MANQVLGKNMQFELFVSGNWYPLFCGKTAELQIEQDVIETTNVNSGIAKECVPGMGAFTVNATGVTVIDNTENRIALSYLIQQSQRRQISRYRLSSTAQNSSTQTITFYAFLITGILSKDVTQWSQSNASFRVTGELEFDTTIPPPATPTCEQEPTIYTTIADGVLYVESALLKPGAGETITILHVSRSGMTYYETSGSPGNNEFLYSVVGANGRITFQFAGNPAPLEPVSIEYKIET